MQMTQAELDDSLKFNCEVHEIYLLMLDSFNQKVKACVGMTSKDFVDHS